MHTQTGTHASSPPAVRRSRTALRWLATFIGFPLGGFIAEVVVGPVDGPVPAIVGGAITGGCLGVVQWYAIRRSGPRMIHWVSASAVGMAGGLAAGAGLVGYGTATSDLVTQGAVCGAVLGIAQSLPLAGRLGRLAAGWPVVLTGLWAVGWATTAGIGVDVDAQYTVFGSSGALVVAAGTSLLPIALARARTATP